MRRHETVRQILGVLIGGLVAETSTAVWAERQVLGDNRFSRPTTITFPDLE